MRRLAIIVATLLVAACGSSSPSGFVSPPGSSSAGVESAGSSAGIAPASSAPSAAQANAPQASGELLVIRVGEGTADDGLVVVDPASGRVAARLPIGAPDPSWTTLYTVETPPGSTGTAPTTTTTTIRALDVRTGTEARRTQLTGSWRLPAVVASALPEAVAADGGHLVLVDSAAPAGSSGFAILDSRFVAPPTFVRLNGGFDFDASSATAGTIYLIEHLVSGTGDYQVRSYDVGSGRLSDGPIIDKRDVEESMAGRPVARAVSDGGEWVDTIYIRDEGTAFVHQLETAQGLALCVDLPDDLVAANGADAGAWRIALTGTTGGFIANSRLGVLGGVDIGALGSVAPASRGSVLALAADRVHAYVLEPTRLAMLGPDLGVVASVPIEGRGLALTRDGTTVNVLTFDGSIQRAAIAGSGLTESGAAVKLDPAIDWTGARIVATSAKR
jgi:hypothetical protein